MPVLPLIDLMILVAWTFMIWAVFHKALWLALASRFTVLGLTPYDFVLGGAVCLLFALALAARVWVKANEARLLRARVESPEPLPEFHPPEANGEEARHEEAQGAAMGDRATAG